MTLSFRSRLALRWALAFGLLLAVANLVVYAGTKAFLTRELDAQLRTLGNTELASAFDDAQGAHLHESPTANTTGTDKFVQLIDADGRVLMQSPALGVTTRLLDGETLVSAFAGQAPIVPVHVGARTGRMVALRTAGANPYLVAVGVYSDRLEATLLWTRQLLVVTWIGALLATGLIGFALASQALAPIRRITAQAMAISERGGPTRLEVPTVDDEIGRMTRLLNRMLDRLFTAIDANRRFAADASHELRSPITGVLGEVAVALRRERTPEEYRHTLETVQQRLQEMTVLTDNLMLLVRAHEQRRSAVTEVVLAPLVYRLVAALQATLSTEVPFALDVPPDVVVYADERLLERAIDNVLRNAAQYGGPMGAVHIAARLEARQGDWVADQVVLTVSDSGPGIPRAERERVFERFYRIDQSRSRRTGRSGLGLAIAREVIQLFEGSIQVVDGTTQGATIEIRLPGARVDDAR